MTFMDQDAIIGLVEQLVATIFSKVRNPVLNSSNFTALVSAEVCP